jgi:hypothetical protein
MADRTGLGALGLIFAGVTAVGILITAFVVTGYVNGRLAIENGQEVVAASAGALGIQSE